MNSLGYHTRPDPNVSNTIQIYFQVMDEVGVVPRRVAGASAGAICAALVAAGYSAQELEIILEDDLTEILMGLLHK